MRRRRVTVWGIAMLAVVVLSVAEAVWYVLRSSQSLSIDLGLFAGGALVGWFLLWLGFRAHHIREVLVWPIFGLWFAALWMAMLLMPSITFLGATLGSAIAWFPHCWPLIGIVEKRAGQGSQSRTSRV
jgi:hypothetical protein